MIDLEAIEQRILDYLNDISAEERFDQQIVIHSRVAELLTEEQLYNFKKFAGTETKRPLHITPYMEHDICVVNNRIRPIKHVESIKAL